MTEEDEAASPLVRYLSEEVRWAARDLKLLGYPLGLRETLEKLATP